MYVVAMCPLIIHIGDYFMAFADDLWQEADMSKRSNPFTHLATSQLLHRRILDNWQAQGCEVMPHLKDVGKQVVELYSTFITEHEGTQRKAKDRAKVSATLKEALGFAILNVLILTRRVSLPSCGVH